MYSKTMLESIKRLEASRNKRKKQELPLLTPREKQELLEKFHPDYKKGTMRPLKAGPNKGEKTPLELADLLEAYSLIDPGKFEIKKPDHDVDVLVIGAGGAGASAALLAQENGARVIVMPARASVRIIEWI